AGNPGSTLIYPSGIVDSNSDSTYQIHKNVNGMGVEIGAGNSPSRTTTFSVVAGSANYDPYISMDTAQIRSTRGLQTLWTGAWYMQGSQTASLSQLVSDQVSGIILAWSRWTGSAAANDSWNY